MQSSSSPFARPFIESHCFFLPVGRLCKPCSPSLLSLVLVPFLREKKQNSHAHANKTLNSAKYMTHLIQALKLHTAPQNKKTSVATATQTGSLSLSFSACSSLSFFLFCCSFSFFFASLHCVLHADLVFIAVLVFVGPQRQVVAQQLHN